MRRREARWETKFGCWIDAYGVSRLVQGLHDLGEPISQVNLYQWLAGSSVPRPRIALKLVQLGQGQITLQQIYDHRQELAAASGVASGGTHED